MRISLVAALLACVLGCGAQAAPAPMPQACAHLSPGVVTSARQAILAARRAWLCTKPKVSLQDEADWLDHFDAQLEDGVWYVSSVPPAGSLSGRLVLEVSQSDGAVLQYYRTQ